ncbi:hypothetical protein HAX54_040475 [Datura stramonium]|uniref:Uncharacterized protein n=1 Tax=Datura stramonium TaxID=4076 RepID=A0ABS8VSE9_DATST|nr:hypothetical protein [Datura stramonium]
MQDKKKKNTVGTAIDRQNAGAKMRGIALSHVISKIVEKNRGNWRLDDEKTVPTSEPPAPTSTPGSCGILGDLTRKIPVTIRRLILIII